MTKTTTNLLLMLITILAGTYFYYMLCSSCAGAVKEDPVQEAVVAPVTTETTETTPAVTSYPFAFSDGEFAVNENDNYNFNVSSKDFITPLSTLLMGAIDKLKDYLATNTGKAINLTGYYKGDETNSTAFPNLGLARANEVKNHLVSNGIDSRQINTEGVLMDEMIAEDNVYLGPISYSIADLINNDDEMQALYDRINADPLVLNFNTNQAEINLTAAQRQKVADISRYLDQVAGASCTATGHTDSQGSSATNQILGQERADFAKSYLSTNGIPASKINADSKGESQPIADNLNAAGRAKNRRTVVTLNK